jgi:hypothetical protein
VTNHISGPRKINDLWRRRGGAAATCAERICAAYAPPPSPCFPFLAHPTASKKRRTLPHLHQTAAQPMAKRTSHQRHGAAARGVQAAHQKQTVLPSAETAAMLFWVLLVSGQIIKTLSENPLYARLRETTTRRETSTFTTTRRSCTISSAICRADSPAPSRTSMMRGERTPGGCHDKLNHETSPCRMK